jgi:hypothetical protein
MFPAIKIADHNSNGNWVEFYEVQSESRPGVAYGVAKFRKGMGVQLSSLDLSTGATRGLQAYPACARPDCQECSAGTMPKFHPNAR